MITKKIIAARLLAYLRHECSLEDLINWAENALLNNDYEDDEQHTIRDTLALLGLSDVKAFGLDWNQCELLMSKLGFKLEVKALEVA